MNPPNTPQTNAHLNLQLEFTAHHPMSGVDQVLALLRQAEFGQLFAQAELFTDMEERDAHIYAEMAKRKLAVAKLDWSLAPPADAGAKEKKAVADLRGRIADTIDISTLVFDLCDAIGHGYACLEIEWGRDGAGLWLPVKLHPRPQRWFTVDRQTRQQIRLRSPDNFEGVELVPYGWIVHLHSAKTGYPGTNGLFRVLALPYLFKNFAIRNWLRFCELYGIPLRALFHSEKDEAKRNQLLQALKALGANGVALFDGATGEDLKTIPLTQGEGQGFEALVSWAERSVSKAVLGGTLTSQADGASSTNALGKVHDDSRLVIRDHDAKQVAATLSEQLFGAVIRLNALSVRQPRFVFDTEEGEDLTRWADALPKLVGVNFQIPVKWVHDRLRIPMPEGGEAVLKTQSAPVGTGSEPAIPSQLASLGAGHVCLSAENPAFTPQQQTVEGLADALLKRLSGPIDDAVIKSAILAATDPEDLENRLATVLLNADVGEFRRVLERALFAADVMGYAHAEGK